MAVKKIDLSSIINFLKLPDTSWSSGGSGEITIKYDVTPDQFLEFAEADLASNQKQSLVNGLANAKRALDSQIDLIINHFGLSTPKKGRRFLDFPDKIEIFEKLGIIAPRVLRRINKTRNDMEHKFKHPSKQTVEDAVDVVALFLAYTNKFIFQFPTDADFENEEHMWTTKRQDYISMSFNEKRKSMTFRGTVNGVEAKRLICKSDNPLYLVLWKEILRKR